MRIVWVSPHLSAKGTDKSETRIMLNATVSPSCSCQVSYKTWMVESGEGKGGWPWLPIVIYLSSSIRSPHPCLVPGPVLGVGWRGRLGVQMLRVLPTPVGVTVRLPFQGQEVPAVVGQGREGWLTCPCTWALAEDAGGQYR